MVQDNKNMKSHEFIELNNELVKTPEELENMTLREFIELHKKLVKTHKALEKRTDKLFEDYDNIVKNKKLDKNKLKKKNSPSKNDSDLFSKY
jgi:hypothetical protein